MASPSRNIIWFMNFFNHANDEDYCHNSVSLPPLENQPTVVIGRKHTTPMEVVT